MLKPDATPDNDRTISRLYSLEPSGYSTPYIESLTSYIARLANAHLLPAGLLIAKEIAPILQREHNLVTVTKSGSWFYKYSGAINGMGLFAQGFTNVLEGLTHKDDLTSLTLTRLKRLVAERALCRSTRSWCPHCLNEMLLDKDEVYEPMLWNVKAVTVCPRHKIRLSATCPHDDCGVENLMLSYNARPGFCHKCGKWLGIEQKLSPIDFEESNMQIWIAENIGYLILAMQHKDFAISSEQVRLGLVSLVDRETGGNVAAFARMVKLPKVTLWSWYRGENLPTLGGLLRICYMVNQPLFDVLFLNCNESLNQTKKKIDTQINGCKNILSQKFDYESIMGQIEDIISASESLPPSLSSVAKQLGYNPKTLHKYYPEQCKKISSRFAMYKREQGQMRFEILCQELKHVILQLYQDGIYPSRRKVEELMNHKAALKEKPLQIIWKETLMELFPKN